MARTAKWADGPWTLFETPSATKDVSQHTAHYIANEMAFAHNAMLRGMNALYIQATHIPREDVPDFLFFAASWADWVVHHHTLEETVMFPKFETVPGVGPGSLQSNVDQHYAFADGIAALHDYATGTTAASYGGGQFQKLIEDFADSFREHLVDEIKTLWNMESALDSKKLLEIYQHCEAEAGKNDKDVIPPMVLGLCHKGFQGGNNWPKMPVGSSYIVHYLFGRKHRGAWRFLPCDTWGKRRELPFTE